MVQLKDLRILYFLLTCFDALCTSSASCAERTTPAGDGGHGSVGVATDSTGITITGRSHRVAVGRVGQPRGMGHPRTEQLGATHPIRAQTGRGKVQRSRGQAWRCCPSVCRMGDVDVVAGEAVVGGAEAGVGAECQGCVRVGMGQGW